MSKDTKQNDPLDLWDLTVVGINGSTIQGTPTTGQVLTSISNSLNWISVGSVIFGAVHGVNAPIFDGVNTFSFAVLAGST